MYSYALSQAAAQLQSGGVITITSIKIYANGTLQANSFIHTAPADGSLVKMYFSNNDIQAVSVIAVPGIGMTRIFANGQIQASGLIYST